MHRNRLGLDSFFGSGLFQRLIILGPHSLQDIHRLPPFHKTTTWIVLNYFLPGAYTAHVFSLYIDRHKSLMPAVEQLFRGRVDHRTQNIE